MARGRRATGAAGVATVDSGADRTALWHSLRAYPEFRVLFNGTLASNSAFWMWQIATGWLALVLTDSPFFVGLTGFLGGIPVLLFALPAGVLIDRVDRRSVLLAAQVAVTFFTALVAALLWLELLRPWHLLVAAFGAGTAMSLVFPTRNALVANIVPSKDLANAVALNAAGQNAPRIVGPAMAGPLIATIGLSGTFAVCAALQVIAIVVTVRLARRPPAPPAVRRTLLSSVGEGLDVIRRSEYLTGLIILAAVPTMLVMPYLNLMPVFARDVLHIGSTGLGLLMAANGVGAVLGSLLVAGSSRLANHPRVLVWTTIAFAVSVLAFALTPFPIVAGVLVFIAGTVSAIYMAVNNTQIQLNVEDSVRGRVLSVYMLTWGLLPLGVLPVGAAADAFGAPLAVAGMVTIALVAIVLTTVRFPSLRQPARAEEPAGPGA